MTYNVHQHWDPLKVCAVGQSYPPEFYNFIKNQKVQSVMKRIAEETEEDYQSLIKMLHGFGVETVRTVISDDFDSYKDLSGKYSPPPMTPRDYTAMVGDKFFMPEADIVSTWHNIRGQDWPEYPTKDLPDWVITEIRDHHGIDPTDENLFRFSDHRALKPIEDLVKKQGNEITYDGGEINSAMTIRIGRDLYHGTKDYNDNQNLLLTERQEIFPNYRNHIVNSGGHSDGVFCPVKPGLIISLRDMSTYQETFPEWEVVYLPNQSWEAVLPFLALKKQNKGKWWVPGEELNDDFTNFVESWLGHWVGYVEESVFDVNMLVIDEKNVICNNENDQVFEAFVRHGITPHVCNFRHRYFWDGGLHCITSDLHREGQQQDYFPNRS